MDAPFYKVARFGGCACAEVVKGRRRKRRKVGSPDYLAWLEKKTASFSKPLKKFFKEEAKRLAQELADKLHLTHAAKAAPSTPADIKQILDELDFSHWVAITGVLDAELYAAFLENAKGGFELIGFDPSEDITALINDRAVEYAQDRSAELVGMRVDADGNMVENPNAAYAITDSTREGIQGLVEDALSEGWGPDDLADELESSYEFSPERAETIARTELAFAHSEGNMAAWEESGEVEFVQWILGSEHDMDDECNENADSDPVPLGDPFPSGHTAAPAHPNCVCDVIPILREEQQ